MTAIQLTDLGTTILWTTLKMMTRKGTERKYRLTIPSPFLLLRPHMTYYLWILLFVLHQHWLNHLFFIRVDWFLPLPCWEASLQFLQPHQNLKIRPCLHPDLQLLNPPIVRWNQRPSRWWEAQLFVCWMTLPIAHRLTRSNPRRQSMGLRHCRTIYSGLIHFLIMKTMLERFVASFLFFVFMARWNRLGSDIAVKLRRYRVSVPAELLHCVQFPFFLLRYCACYALGGWSPFEEAATCVEIKCPKAQVQLSWCWMSTSFFMVLWFNMPVFPLLHYCLIVFFSFVFFFWFCRARRFPRKSLHAYQKLRLQLAKCFDLWSRLLRSLTRKMATRPACTWNY